MQSTARAPRDSRVLSIGTVKNGGVASPIAARFGGSPPPGTSAETIQQFTVENRASDLHARFPLLGTTQFPRLKTTRFPSSGVDFSILCRIFQQGCRVRVSGAENTSGGPGGGVLLPP